MGDANAEASFLVVVEHNFGQGLEGDGHVDGARGLAANACVREDVARGLLKDVIAGSGGPGGVDGEFAGVCAALCGVDAVVANGAVFTSVGGFDGIGVIPEVEVVGVAVVEPEAGVVRVVDAFALDGLEGKTASDGGAIGCDEGIEDRLALVGVPEVGGEGLAVDGDVDSMRSFVDRDVYAFAVFGESGDCDEGE